MSEMAALLLGAENEYAISASSWVGDTSCETLAHALVERIARRYPCIRDAQGHGYFLLNGARVYVDCGNHPEISSPECTDPRDVVRYVRAGELHVSLSLVVDKSATPVALADSATAFVAFFECGSDVLRTLHGPTSRYLRENHESLFPWWSRAASAGQRNQRQDARWQLPRGYEVHLPDGEGHDSHPGCRQRFDP